MKEVGLGQLENNIHNLNKLIMFDMVDNEFKVVKQNSNGKFGVVFEGEFSDVHDYINNKISFLEDNCIFHVNTIDNKIFEFASATGGYLFSYIICNDTITNVKVIRDEKN